MNLEIKLKFLKPFAEFMSKLKNKYDSKFEMMNYLSNGSGP